MRSVEVVVGDRCYPGTLEHWKHDERGWVAYVWWSEGPGLTHVEWIKAERLRPAEA